MIKVQGQVPFLVVCSSSDVRGHPGVFVTPFPQSHLLRLAWNAKNASWYAEDYLSSSTQRRADCCMTSEATEPNSGSCYFRRSQSESPNMILGRFFASVQLLVNLASLSSMPLCTFDLAQFRSPVGSLS